MNILVCIKQVPDTGDIKWTKNNTLKRDEMDSVINPFDEFSLETALRIKDYYPETKITVISMGPKQSETSIREALALGCDEGVLICDKKFSGADTVSTSNTIASAIKNCIKNFDLIICGQFATDGDTAQTPPEIAEKLDIPQITYVTKIVDINGNKITVEKETDYGIETLKTTLPTLLSVQKCDYELRKAKIDGYIFAQNKSVELIDFSKLGVEENSVGMKGSPTYVSKAFRPEIKREGKLITIDELKNIIEKKEGV